MILLLLHHGHLAFTHLYDKMAREERYDGFPMN